MSCLACSDRSGPGWIPSARSRSAAGRAGSPASPSTGCRPICARWWNTTLTTLHGLNVSAADSSGSLIEAASSPRAPCAPARIGESRLVVHMPRHVHDEYPPGRASHGLHHTPMGECRQSQHETRTACEVPAGAFGAVWLGHVADVGMAPPLRIIEVPKGRLVAGGHPLDGRREAATRDPPGASPHLASARERFLTAEPVKPGVVRRSIMASWIRSREWKVPADHFDLPYDPNPNRDTRLTYSASNVIGDLAEQLAGEPVCIVLTDAQGVVLDRRTGDSTLRAHLDRVKLDIGFSYSEQHVGTNGIGTALEGRGPAEVFGHEHYVEHLEDLACAGAPIHHPVTGKLLGVIDLTCWRTDANPLMMAAATTAAKRIEEALFEHAGGHEVALLQDYLLACRRAQGAVLAISNDML